MKKLKTISAFLGNITYKRQRFVIIGIDGIILMWGDICGMVYMDPFVLGDSNS